MKDHYTLDETNGRFMDGTKSRALLAWCESDDCGEPIYEGSKHVEQVSDAGSRYFYCTNCAVKPVTPDEKREEN